MKVRMFFSSVRRVHPVWTTAILLLALLLISAEGAFANTQLLSSNQVFRVQVVSSDPQQVTGGDARLHIEVPNETLFSDVAVLVNGFDQSANFSPLPGTHSFTGVIDDLQLGSNTVQVKLKQAGGSQPPPFSLTLTNYPITGPVFSGPHQYPFVCTVQTSGLGQPLVDNAVTGIPVYAEDENGSPTGEIIGYSRDCSIETQVDYSYVTTGGRLMPYTLGSPRPVDMAQTTLLDGRTVDFFVRWERGTINRFIYSIVVLVPFDTNPQGLDKSSWNGRAIYYFGGGVGIGHTQGTVARNQMLYSPGLGRGYAIVTSSGNTTGNHFNLVLGGETALMVKERFIELFDLPLYTLGLGSSGGAIQQYIYAQNHPGLIDGAIPMMSFPDMVTQAVHASDCELLEYYMDILDGANPRWSDWENRTLIEGMNASNTVFNPYTQEPGSSECVTGYRGLTPLAFNPHYGFAPNQESFIPYSAIASTEWTNFGDLVNYLGSDEDGFAHRYLDNVGVQYGLKAVASGEITPEEFMDLNARIGGWKPSASMVQEGSPFYPPGVIDFSNWDPWSARNQVVSTDPLVPAPRTQGDVKAMQALYTSGFVFTGDVGIPIIDWRPYMEARLDMHNSHQSFAARQRIRDARGNSDNQIIWFTDAPQRTQSDPILEALALMDEWLVNIHAHPELGVAGNKPLQAVDRCFEANGQEIASGEDVWDGVLDSEPTGACAQRFPVYGTSRTAAGGPFKGSIFKCQLKLVAQAIADGDYGVWTPTAEQVNRLQAIFPEGVCDFSLPDTGLPPG